MGPQLCQPRDCWKSHKLHRVSLCTINTNALSKISTEKLTTVDYSAKESTFQIVNTKKRQVFTTNEMELKRKTRTLVIRIVMLTVYLTSGAAIFSAIEHDGGASDEHFTDKINELKENMTRRFNETREVIDRYIEELRGMFEEAHRCKYSHNDWSYYQSLYFVGSVTTTIGKKKETFKISVWKKAQS